MSAKVSQLREQFNQLNYDNKQLSQDIQMFTKLCTLLEKICVISIPVVMNCNCIENNNLIISQLNELHHKCNDLKVYNNKNIQKVINGLNIAFNINDNNIEINEELNQTVYKYIDLKEEPKVEEKSTLIAINRRRTRNTNVYRNQKPKSNSTDIKKNISSDRKKCNKVSVVYMCDWPQCQYTSNAKKRVKYHRMRHTGIKPFKCQECDAMFMNNSELVNHKWRHTGEKQYNCCWPGCDKKFSCKSNLTQHIRLTHQQIKRVKCHRDDCGLLFDDKRELIAHEFKVHNGVAPYQCDWPGCDFKTAYDHTFKRHKMRHTGEKRFKCSWPECDCTFRQNCHLKTHMLKHTGEKPWICEVHECERKFQTKQAMKIHIQNYHQSIHQSIPQ